MAPLKIALVGVLGIGVAASLAFADHQPNHQGGGDPVAAPAGYAFMVCDYVEGSGVTPRTLRIDAAGDPNSKALLISGGTDPGITTATDSCHLAIKKLLLVGWRLHTVRPDNDGTSADLYYHFVSP